MDVPLRFPMFNKRVLLKCENKANSMVEETLSITST